MNQALISIITVVFNGEKYLEKTIQSVINQTYENIEYIIIDGGSTDGTVDIIKQYQDEITMWISEKDNGIYDAMNKGIKLSDDDSFLIFLNAGDIFVSGNVLKNITKKIYHETKVIFGSANIYNENNNFLTNLKPLKFTKSNLNKFGTRVVCHQAIFIHKSIVKLYSLNYRLKSELNWYYDIVSDIDNNEVVKSDIEICDYMQGGEGDKHFFENMLERVKVTYFHNNIVQFILIMPFFLIPLLFRLKRVVFGK